MPEKTAKPVKKRTPSPRAKTAKRAQRSAPSHHQISERAYFIHLHEAGSDELGNWLRAERELTAA